MPSDWKDLLSTDPILRSLMKKAGSETTIHTHTHTHIRVWTGSRCHGDNMKLLLFLIQSVQSSGFQETKHIFPRLLLLSWRPRCQRLGSEAGSFLHGSRSDSSVDHGIVTEQWSSYIALPQIPPSPSHPLPFTTPPPPYRTIRDSTGPEFVLSISWRVINFSWHSPVRAKPKCWLSDSVYVFTGATSRSGGA